MNIEVANQPRQRQTELDLLKICAFICVVCLHVAAKPWQLVPLDSWQWAVSNFFRGTWAVPVFVMISGRFLLDPEKSMTWKKLKRYLVRAVVAFLFWSGFYEAYQLLIAYPSRGVAEINWKWEIVEFMTGEYHLWYLPMLSGLYLVTPFLRKIVPDRQLMCWYLVLFVIFETIACYVVHLPKIGVLIAPVFGNLNFHFAMGYTGYFVMGYYLHSCRMEPKAVQWLYVFGAVCLMITPVADIVHGIFIEGERVALFSENLTPNVMIMSAAIFVFFSERVSRTKMSENTRKWIGKLADCGFGAYLIHVLFLNLFVDFIGIKCLEKNPIVWIPILTFIFSGASLTAAAAIRRLPVIGKYIA